MAAENVECKAQAPNLPTFLMVEIGNQMGDHENQCNKKKEQSISSNSEIISMEETRIKVEELPSLSIPNCDSNEQPVTNINKKSEKTLEKFIMRACFGSRGRNRHTYSEQDVRQENTTNQPVYRQQVIAGQVVYVEGQAPPPPPQNAARMPAYRPGIRNPSDEIVPQNFQDSFSDREIRRKFVQRVYTILSVQLLFTCVLISIMCFIPSVRSFVIRASPLYYAAMAVEMTVYIMLVCCDSIRRNFPTNVICLAIFTLAFAYLMGVIAAMYDAQTVLGAMAATAVITVAVTIFAKYTSWDITGWCLYLYILSYVFLLFTIIIAAIAYATGHYRLLFILVGLFGSLLFSLYLMYDTQQLMGGRKIELSPEEHILGAILLYIDIMNIFQYMMCLLCAIRS